MPFRSLLLLLLVFSGITAHAWEWFSDKPQDMKALLADPREAQARVGFLYSGSRHSYLDLGLGGRLGLVRDTQPERAISVNIKGLLTARFGFNSPYFDYLNGDMMGGAALSYKKTNDVYEIFPYHQSSHLGAEALVHLGKTFKVFSYESVRLLHSHSFGESLRTYEGAEIKVRANPSELTWKPTAIAGAEFYFLPSVPELFSALDFHFKAENEWAPNTTLVVGYELGKKADLIRAQRVFLELFNGYSNMGQFSTEREFYLFFGMGFTI